jgi:hypothetical protein
LFDGDGLYLFVSTTGHRAWRFKYCIDGKEKHLHFGRYPEISLKAAREQRLEARRALEMGNDPGAIQKAERAARSETITAKSVRRSSLNCRDPLHRGTWLRAEIFTEDRVALMVCKPTPSSGLLESPQAAKAVTCAAFKTTHLDAG